MHLENLHEALDRLAPAVPALAISGLEAISVSPFDPRCATVGAPPTAHHVARAYRSLRPSSCFGPHSEFIGSAASEVDAEPPARDEEPFDFGFPCAGSSASRVSVSTEHRSASSPTSVSLLVDADR
jgi:hypothetical protein